MYHLWKEIAQTLLAQHRKLIPNVTKNKLPDKDKMTSSNNYKLYPKSYLKFFEWVADKMQGY